MAPTADKAAPIVMPPDFDQFLNRNHQQIKRRFSSGKHPNDPEKTAMKFGAAGNMNRVRKIIFFQVTLDAQFVGGEKLKINDGQFSLFEPFGQYHQLIASFSHELAIMAKKLNLPARFLSNICQLGIFSFRTHAF
uniref:Uncharacterized protein n=1 Tax=Panagrolaimus sp. JU765 TaxID=591449 RepID=A0AC34QEY3_9BILA